MSFTIEDFSKLPECLQIEFATTYPAIAVRSDKGYRYILYQVESFYVEFKFNKPSKKKDVICYNAFCSGKRLKPYLKKLDISEILDCFNA